MPTTNLAPIQIVQFPTTKIALLEHRGDPLTIGDSIRKFIAWRKRHRLHPSASATFNLLYEDPEAVAAEQFRLGLGAATELTIEANTEGVIASEIPSARCATIRVIGSDAALAMSLQQLYCDWLPTSGEEPSDFPLFVQRVQFYPDVPEQQAVTDVFLPLR